MRSMGKLSSMSNNIFKTSILVSGSTTLAPGKHNLGMALNKDSVGNKQCGTKCGILSIVGVLFQSVVSLN